MFKIETIVKLTVCLVMASATGALRAADDSLDKLADKLNGGSHDKGESIYKLHCGKPVDSEYRDWCKRYEDSAIGSDDCSSAPKQFSTAQSEFSGACGKAGIASDGYANDIACGGEIKQCDCRFPKNQDKKIGEIDCSNVGGSDGGESSTPRSSSLFGGQSSADSKAEKSTLNNFKYCPGMAVGAYEQLKKDADKAEEDADKKEDDLPTKLDDANKARNEGLDKVSEFDDKMNTAQSEFEKSQEEAQKNKSEQQKALMNQISQLQQQSQQLDEQIGQAELAEGKAAMQRDETKKQIELNCHATAAAQAGKAMADFVEQVRNGQANLGGQRDIVKRANTTLETIYDRKATEIYNRCLRSKPTIASKDSADKVFDDAVHNFEVAKKNARDRKAQILQQIKQIKDPSGQCGQVVQQADGSNNETDMCRALRESAQTQQRVYNEFQRKTQTLQQQKALAQQKAANEYMTKMQAYQKAQQDVAKKRAKADSLRREAQAAESAGAGAGADSKSYSEATSKYGQMVAAAQVLATCCYQEKTSGSSCDKASKFLKLVGVSVDETRVIAPPGTGPAKIPPHTPPAGCSERPNDPGCQ